MEVYKYRVVLDHESDVFRDIEIQEDSTFEKLYNAIIQSFGFDGGQLASFYMSNEEWDKGREIGLMDMGGGDYDDLESLPAVMSTAVLSDFMEDERQKVILVYDFLKMWIFYIERVETNDAEAGVIYPRVSLSFGTAPDEEDKDMPDLMEGIDLSGGPEGSELDDIFSDEEDDGPEFENIDDLDI